MYSTIPNIIHYCWYGNNDIPELTKHCLKSWKRLMPNHKIICWNEKNSPMEHPYMKRAYAEKKWANLSNFMRLYALKEYGGWYFDTDVELVKNPDVLSEFNETCFLGLESKPGENKWFVNNAVVAASINHPFINISLSRIENLFDGTESANLSSPELTTQVLKDFGFTGTPNAISGIRILSNDYFYPSAWYEKFQKDMITSNTIAIHHNDATWIKNDEFNDQTLRTLLKDHARIKQQLRNQMNARVTWQQWIKWNLKFFIEKFSISK